MKTEKYKFIPGQSNLITDFDPQDTNGLKNKKEALHELEDLVEELINLQDIFFVNKKYGLLVILQGMDASGKDGIIKHVFSGVNPHGLKIRSFSTPTKEEYAHDYLWRCTKELPERGYIGVFNRSYYEEVLIQRVHPNFLNNQNLPSIPKTEEEFSAFWEMRFTDINNYEKYLVNNGFLVVKFFLNISKEEQKRRFLRRIDRAAKNWKFRPDDLSERGNWDKYTEYYQEMMEKTSTEHAPWYIIPGDHKWYARPTVCKIINETLSKLKQSYPTISFREKKEIVKSKHQLLNENEIPLDTTNPSV